MSLLCCLVWHYPSSVGWASCPVLISEQAGRLCVHSRFWSRGPCLVVARKSETVLRIHHLDSATARPYALHFPPLHCIHMDTLWRQRVWVRLGGLSALLTTAPKGVLVGPNSHCLSLHCACFHVSLPAGMMLCQHGKRLLTVSSYTGRCQWEWSRSLRTPGRTMAYIKLLSLSPPCGSHWHIGGFQQCRVCVFGCCSSLAWRLLGCVVVL